MKKSWLLLRQALVVFVIFTFLAVFFSIGVSPQKAQNQSEANDLFDKFSRSDSVSRAIRSKAKDFINVRINSLEDRANVEKVGTIVEDYGSFVVLAKDKTANLSGSKLDFQSLDMSVNLPSGKFEPLDASRPSAVENSSGKNYYIVQFGGMATGEWLKSLEVTGAEIVQYVPHNSFFVYADDEAIGKIANHSRVRWVGNYLAEDKISPELTAFTRNVNAPTAMFDIAVFSRADIARVSGEFANSIQGKILDIIKLPNNFFNVI
ncbi:MAG TPA: hypothetical protein VK308_15080, partial [Pyrinomonadaceae bacterium]|nr:hypothetical protein [Pyrinomonadaceae bacterium]